MDENDQESVKIDTKGLAHGYRYIDRYQPAWMRHCGDHNLALLYPQKDIHMRPNERWGFDYIYGDPEDRVQVGPSVAEAGKTICTEQCRYPTHPFWVEGGAEKQDPTCFQHDKKRPMWHLRQFEHLRPWHVEGEQITRHFDRHHNLLATNASYATENDVLDAIRNDEFVQRPPDRRALEWDRYEHKFIAPLLKPGREEAGPEVHYNMYTGRFWGDPENGEITAKEEEEWEKAMMERYEEQYGEYWGKEPKKPLKQRLKKWWIRQSAMRLNGPDLPYKSRCDWDVQTKDIEQNRLVAQLQRQESFDHRFKYAEFRLIEDKMWAIEKAERKRKWLKRKFGFIEHPCSEWNKCEEIHDGVGYWLRDWVQDNIIYA